MRDLRKFLTVKKYLVNYKIKQVAGPGQKANTCARAIIDCFRSKINLSASKYKSAHHSLSLLDQDSLNTLDLFKINWSHCFQPLTIQDMVFLNVDPDDSEDDG